MPGTLPHTQHGFAQTAAEQYSRERDDDENVAADDPTTLNYDGKVSIADDDAGSDPYNRTGRFRRLVR